MVSSWLPQLVRAGQDLSRGLLHLLLPGCCHLCGCLLPDHVDHFCDLCRVRIFHDPEEVCPRCAGRVGPFAMNEGRCRQCRDESYAFERVVRLGPYEDLLREVVLRLKHVHQEGLAEMLGDRWAEHAQPAFQGLAVDVVVPIPLHWRRRWRRGYNQSAALARGLAGRLGLPLEVRGLNRVRNTPSQTSQTPSARRENVRGAFQPGWAKRRLVGKSVLLVDDVMTTGATGQEAARALVQLGAKRVVLAVLARASG